MKMSKFRNWKDVKKEIEADFTEEDIQEVECEKEIIRKTIETRKNANLTQQEQSELTGIVQPSIAKIESFARTPQYTTLMRLLRPMGYTLKIVPLDSNGKDSKRRRISTKIKKA